ncbi:hypothetical protein V5O48_008104 [Marasmius crinis-equi]|uniref:Uncharacterized protein n=1 Tax=Marasmius crinis-equi TaxID=585013 RepID=A0ABR3FES5_9AGAR
MVTSTRWPAYRADCDGNNVSNTTFVLVLRPGTKSELIVFSGIGPPILQSRATKHFPFTPQLTRIRGEIRLSTLKKPEIYQERVGRSLLSRALEQCLTYFILGHPELTGAPLQSSSSSDPRQSSTPIGAIAGGVAGGVILLLAAMAVVFWLRRKGSAKGVQELRRLHRESSFSEMTHAQQGSVSVKYTPLQVHSGASVYEVQTNELGQNIRPVSTYTTLTSSYGHRQSTIAGSPPTDMRVYLPENNIQPFLLSSPQAPSPVSEGAAVSTPPRKGAIVFNPNDPTLGVSRAQENVEDGDYFSEQHNTPGPANPPAYTYYPDAASPPSQRESLLSSTVGDGSYYQGRSTSGQFSPSTVISESSHSVGYGSPYRQSQIPSGSRRTSALPSGSVHGYGGDTGDVEIA